MAQTLVFGAFSFTPPGTTDGIEPWVTDGTAAGTFLLRDINVGSSGSNPTSFFSVNGKVVFYATTPANGSELWVTDGTTDGTTLLADINPGGGSAGVNTLNFTLLGDKLLFTANSPATGTELWVTDGTTAGTMMLDDFTPGPNGGVGQSKPFSILGNTAIFAADGDVWSTDGTPAGTVKIYDFDTTNGNASGPIYESFFKAGNLVYFSAVDGPFTGVRTRELWVTDGSTDGTTRIAVLGPDNGTNFAVPIGTLGGATYFVAQVSDLLGTSLGAELYVSTGTSLELFREFDPGFRSGSINPNPDRVAIAGDQLFFTREISGASAPTELWVIDGATGTTQLLQTFTNITGPNISVFGDSIVFTASTTVGGVQSAFAPWISDGTVEGTQQLLSGNPTASGSNAEAGNYIPFAGKLFFTANGGASTGRELWVTDGTPAGTALFRDIFPGASASSPSDFRVVGDKLFFQATTAGGREYWVTDGTPAGTVQVKDIAIGSLGSVLPAGAFGSAVLGDAAPAAPTYAITGTPTTDEGGQLTFTVTRDIGTAAGAVALALGGTATGGADYAAPGLTVSFAAGETVKTVTIDTLTDTLAEGDETVIVTLGPVTGSGTVSAANGTATGTITNVTPPPVDTVAPTVTINQAVTQVDPTSGTSIVFDVTFSEAVTGFQTGDVTLSGTAGATSAVVSGSGANYTVTVTGMTGPGEVIATIAAGVAIDAAGNASLASTSTDNTVTVASNPVTAVADLYATPSGQTLVVSAANGVLANDTAPDGGAVVVGLLNGINLVGGTLFTGSGGLVSIAADGSLNYVPAAGFRGQETVTYRMRDADGSFADAPVTFDVVNNAPVAVDDVYTVRPGESVFFPIDMGFVLFDTDADRDRLSSSGINIVSVQGALTAFADGSFSYAAPANFTGVETFTYTVVDGFGGSDTGTVTINVVNTAPVAVDDVYTARPGQEISVGAAIGVFANDGDPDGDAFFLTGLGAPASGGAVSVASDGSFTYTPGAGFTGIDTFSYVISDRFGGSDTGTVTINVVNAAPVAVDDSATTAEGVAVRIAVLGNDRDPDGDVLVLGAAQMITGGTVTRDGDAFVFTPSAGFTETGGFDYTVSDGFGGSDTARVTVTVTDTTPDPILRLGTPGNDRLTGTAADEIIDSLGGRADVLAGGGGADTFRFSATANGVRETRTVTDFGSDDALDLGAANVASWRQLGGDVFLYLDLDRDVIILKDVLGYDGDWFV